jgi:hypothetical protein
MDRRACVESSAALRESMTRLMMLTTRRPYWTSRIDSLDVLLERMGTSMPSPPIFDHPRFVGRLPTRYLMQSLHRLASAIDHEDIDAVFDDSGAQPVISANLCDALLRMQPSDDDASLSLNVA